MRLDRGVAQTRKGSQRLTDTVGTTGAPLTLDVALGVDKSVTALTRASTTAELPAIDPSPAAQQPIGNLATILLRTARHGGDGATVDDLTSTQTRT